MQHIGFASIHLKEPVYINAYASIVGKKEGDGPLAKYFDESIEDALFGGNNFEDAESHLQAKTIRRLLNKSNLNEKDINYLLAGDLLGQLIATSFGIATFDIPFLGLYGACSTFGEALSLGALLVSGGFADKLISMASSHFCSAEKTFRFPLGYGSQRRFSATWTVTGCGAVILSSLATNAKAKVTGITTGKIVDFGLKDKENMGACMAPAAADTIHTHFGDFNRTEDYYDKIITGDLGYVGQKILIDLLKDLGHDISDKHMDCGIEIFDSNTQDTHSGGSGCGCSATCFCGYIMNKLETGEYKRVLFIPTGALLSPTSSNEGNNVPGIAHAVVIEAI